MRDIHGAFRWRENCGKVATNYRKRYGKVAKRGKKWYKKFVLPSSRSSWSNTRCLMPNVYDQGRIRAKLSSNNSLFTIAPVFLHLGHCTTFYFSCIPQLLSVNVPESLFLATFFLPLPFSHFPIHPNDSNPALLPLSEYIYIIHYTQVYKTVKI